MTAASRAQDREHAHEQAGADIRCLGFRVFREGALEGAHERTLKRSLRRAGLGNFYTQKVQSPVIDGASVAGAT